MNGRRLETALAALVLVGTIFFLAAGMPMTIWAAIWWIAALLLAAGTLCAKWALAKIRAGRGIRGWSLAIGVASMLALGTVLVGLILAEQTVDNHGHRL